jgi:hypothetical protein
VKRYVSVKDLRKGFVFRILEDELDSFFDSYEHPNDLFILNS